MSKAVTKSKKTVEGEVINKGGRPSKYTQELADDLCARLADGQSLRTICQDEKFPSVVTVFAWMRKHEEFLKQYARAKEEAADAMVDDMLHLADTTYEDPAYVNKAKLQIETRKWIASKLKPKLYGDKVDVTSAGQAITPIIALPTPETPKQG